MIHVLYGDDSFSIHEAVDRLAAAVGPEDVRSSNISRLSAQGFEVGVFANAALVVPFLADRRLVIVDGLLSSLESAGGGRRGRRRAADGDALGAAAGLPEMLAQLPPTTDVAFIDGRLGRANPLLAEVEALEHVQVQVREFPMLRREALARWISDRAHAKGASITPQAVAHLSELIGSNLWTLDSELEKLAVYRSGETIDVEHVDALVSSARETTVFELVDAMMDGRTDRAMAKLQSQLSAGVTGPYLLSMIARQARLLAIAHELSNERVPQSEWGPHLGTASDFVVKKTAEQARRFTMESVRRLYGLLLDADVAMKSGSASEELAMTELVAIGSALRGAAPSRGRR